MQQNKEQAQIRVTNPQQRAGAFRFESGRLCLDFVATVGRRLATPLERLPTPDDLGRWLVEAHLCEAAPSIPVSQHQAALALRETIYRSALAILTQSTIEMADVGLLNAWAAHPTAIPQLDEVTRHLLWCMTEPVEAALAHIARDAVALLGGPDTTLLGACEGAECGMLFINGSRNRRRRWCSMTWCGNLNKVHAYRQRRKGE